MSEHHFPVIAIIGGSLGGLLAASACAPYADRVVVIEHDDLPDHPTHRRGTPQARHAHGLLMSGLGALESLLPGCAADMVAHGALCDGDMGRTGQWWIGGGMLAPTDVGERGVCASRLLLEHTVRERIRELPTVDLMDCAEVTGLTGSASRVTGVRVARRGDGPPTDISADLVIDASGRLGRTERWLADLGCAPIDHDIVSCGIRYATTHIQARTSDLDGQVYVVVAATPEKPFGAAAIRQEDGTWTITMGSYNDDPLPQDIAGIHAFTARLGVPAIDELLGRELLHPLTNFRFPESRRRMFHGPDLPTGYLPIGDAISSFNPMFGQGMSAAALEAVALRSVLQAGAADIEADYLTQANVIVDRAWSLVALADRAIPGVADARVPRSEQLRYGYSRRVQRVAHSDPDVSRTLLLVTSLVEPVDVLLAPRIVCKALGWRTHRAPRSSAGAVATAGRL